MKLLAKPVVDKDGCGTVSVIPLDAEDMWHVYQLLSAGDKLKMKTVRRIQKESNTGSIESERVKVVITIEVVSVDFNPGAEEIRVNGKNSEENKFVKLGAFHTHVILPNRKITIIKECWDDVAASRVEEACNPSRTADTAVAIMEEGLCHICLVTPNMTVVRARIDVNIPGKRKGRNTGYDKATSRFFEAILQAILRHFDFQVLKCVILASPGFVKDDFFKFMMAEAIRKDLKPILDNKNKFILAHSSSGQKHCIREVLADPNVSCHITDTKAALEVKALQDFFNALKDDCNRATYGPKHVKRAAENGAIQTLLIVDDIFRSCSIAERKEFVQMGDTVKEFGGDVRIFSSQHVSGEQLTKFTGIAAVLRFPFADVEEDEEDDLSFLDEDDKGKEPAPE